MSESTIQQTHIPFETMKSEFTRILLKHGFTAEKAGKCASIFAESSLDGVYSHGVNRFPRFIGYIQKGYVFPDVEATLTHTSGAIEQWNGNLGAGPLNATFATQRAMYLADKNGVGMVALANTNHWMRGGTYGWQAAKAGYIFIGWTNTTPNMPAWGGKNPKLGNNPLVIAIPHETEAVVLDMAMSQYSFGTMENQQLKGEKLPTAGGYDKDGNLTDDPAKILESWRPLPIGYWKGAALSLVLDMLAAVLSGGLFTAQIGQKEEEYGISQVYIAISPAHLGNYAAIDSILNQIIADYKSSLPINKETAIRYPGERIIATRTENLKNGIPVNRKVWEEILKM
jgi:3-dehydro-L-gulonate 2-dehydrogenase